MRQIRIGKYQLHFGEEPCISGTRGSGAVFFSGCNLRCAFCQNYQISREGHGKQITTEELADIFKKLEDAGAHNINLVTAASWVDRIIEAFEIYRPNIPVVYNSSGYESMDDLIKLEKYVDVYLPDYKFADEKLAEKFSRHADYPTVAKAAIREMIRQKGTPVFDESGLITSGVIIRHLVLPLHLKNTAAVLNSIKEEFPDAWISYMLQYTPVYESKYPELNRTLTPRECERAALLLEEIGLDNGYTQGIEAATRELIPEFYK